MRFLRFVAASLLAASVSFSSFAQSAQEKYISKYSEIAVEEMYRSGVPASITLAQGLLESRYGLSPLAADGNNHFGIKCHDWKGKKQYVDDDRKEECFRKYDAAEESFHDHSDFLRYRDRYKFLFEYKTTDYKSWAYGLKKAGYATDPAYPSKLIKLIEDYELFRYDTMVPGQAGKTAKAEKTAKATKSSKSSKANKASRRRKESTATVAIPQSPLSFEEPVKVERAGGESYTFSLSRRMYSLNGVPFIYAAEGETIESIAKANNLFSKELRRFNDMRPGQEPEPGDIVYLQKKKKQTQKGMDMYIADEDGESLWTLSQRYAVRLPELARRNSVPENYTLKTDDEILLR